MAFPIIGGVVGMWAMGWVRKTMMTVALFLAAKTLLKVLILTALPIILYNVGTMVIFDFMDLALSYVNNSGLPTDFTIQLTGLGGWIAQKIQLPQAFSMYMSAVSVRYFLNLLRA